MVSWCPRSRSYQLWWGEKPNTTEKCDLCLKPRNTWVIFTWVLRVWYWPGYASSDVHMGVTLHQIVITTDMYFKTLGIDKIMLFWNFIYRHLFSNTNPRLVGYRGLGNLKCLGKPPTALKSLGNFLEQDSNQGASAVLRDGGKVKDNSATTLDGL